MKLLGHRLQAYGLTPEKKISVKQIKRVDYLYFKLSKEFSLNSTSKSLMIKEP